MDPNPKAVANRQDRPGSGLPRGWYEVDLRSGDIEHDSGKARLVYGGPSGRWFVQRPSKHRPGQWATVRVNRRPKMFTKVESAIAYAEANLL